MATRVIYKLEDNGDILAVFPSQVGTRSPNTCQVFTASGEHSHAQVDYVKALRPVTLTDARALHNALIARGYLDLVVVHEFTRADLVARIKQLSAAHPEGEVQS